MKQLSLKNRGFKKSWVGNKGSMTLHHTTLNSATVHRATVKRSDS